MKKGKYLIALGLFVLYLVFAASLYQKLPASFPVHFGFSGAPDHWADKNMASWFLIPAINGIIILFLLLTGVFVRKYPALLNVPDKEKFLASPAEKQSVVFDLLDDLFLALSIALQLLFGFITYASYSAAITPEHDLPTSFFLVIIGYGFITLGIVIYYLIKIRSVLK
jgi:uncharacterized membrane protein